MPVYLRPGVYIEETDAAGDPYLLSLPPQPVGGLRGAANRRAGRTWMAEHSVAAFVGIAGHGPVNTPVPIGSWSEFQRGFGETSYDDAFLDVAVQGYFANGGRQCWVVRVGEADRPGDADHVVGSVADRTGLGGLEVLDDVSTVCVPDLMALYASGAFDLEAVKAVQLGLIAHCELMGDRIAVLDTPPNLNVQQVREWRMDFTAFDTQFAAMYYPWIRVHSRLGSRAVPPSGAVAGVYARSDMNLGPHRSPANQPLAGVLGTDYELTLIEEGLLSPVGVNTLTTSAGRGVLVWGARTLSSDPDWRYLRKRRLMNLLSRNIRGVTDWVVFDERPFDDLRAEIVGELDELLSLVWRSGALDGDLPEDAYQVRCDAGTTPAEALDANQIVADCRAMLAGAGPVSFRVVYFRG